MGTYIGGWVEYELEGDWYGAINIICVVDQYYDAFACLFGVKNYAGFKAIAPNRGLPDDISEEVLRDTPTNDLTHDHSWISLDEIEAIDWEEYAENLDQRISQYHKDESGERVWHSKGRLLKPPPIDLSSAGQFEYGGILYEVRTMQRKEVLQYWQPLIDMMRIVAKKRGNVRLVVYFDS